MDNIRDGMDILQTLQIFRLFKDRYQLFKPVLLISTIRPSYELDIQVHHSEHGLSGR